MSMRSTFEISTQMVLLKIDGFLKGWILNITPLKVSVDTQEDNTNVCTVASWFRFI